MSLQIVPFTATTGVATAITSSSSTLNGSVGDNGQTTTVSFDYGTTTSYGTNVAATAPAGGTIAGGSGSTAVSVGLTGLSANTTYHFRVKASGTSPTVNGSDATFTISSITPVITAPPTASAITFGQSLASSTLSGGSANVTPATLAAGAAATSASLSISVPQQTAMLHTGETLGRMSLALLLLPFSGKIRRRMRKMPRALVILFVLIGGAAGVAGLTGCSGANGFFGQAQQTYNVSVATHRVNIRFTSSAKLCSVEFMVSTPSSRERPAQALRPMRSACSLGADWTLP